ncbi:universal stress protein [Mycolicibacterium alvei]|uniref:Universal stress protein n=1 Tax=Mycolicibacterium alvei TaxID=67081 RepID=A0A6N4USG1_9MYCO|nr:universal stress protein [Mycolicibacterium alvei]MCV6999070.1 universal stress protein [Mycolicibacterium alvei]BBX26372.1 universal stress protein [Mycolicibacterium alvei]
MSQQNRPRSVVVGIDGSQAAIDAATWAVSEAVNRGVPLRLVYASPANRATAHTADAAESALSRAQTIIGAMGTPVDIETAVVRGRPGCVLIEESRAASMVCVGSAGKGPCAGMPLGPTAAALVKYAQCEVAVIRAGGTSQGQGGWIAVVQNDEPDNDAVVGRAMAEGRLRKAPVLLIDRRLDSWVRRYPDVRVQTVATSQTRPRSIENDNESIQLAVVGSADAERIGRLVRLDYHPVLGRANRSVLLVRN